MLIERILDLTSILTLFVIFAFRRWNEFSHDPAIAAWFYIVRIGAIAALVILLLLAFFVFGIFFFRSRIRRLHERLGRLLPARFREPWMHFFDSFTEALELTRHRRGFATVLLCTVGLWLSLNSQFWLATRAVHHPLPFDASFFTTGVTTVGLAIPTPGGIGGFHKACQLVLTRFYRFGLEPSVAVAVIFHLIGTLPVLVTGLLLFAKQGLKWRDVTRG
jgi:uncharacterized membrane protein YbhN (UPF0104 family)